MRFFQEIEVPEHIWICEAAYWIAFGVLPTADKHGSTQDLLGTDIREQVDLILEREGHLFSFRLVFSAGYMEQEFPSIDPKRYLELEEKCLGEKPEEILKSISSAKKIFNFDKSAFSSEEIVEMEESRRNAFEAYQQQLEAAQELRVIQNPINMKLQAAQLQLLSKIISREIPAKGLQLPAEDTQLDTWGPDDWPTAFSEIDASEWDIAGVDWDDSNLENWRNRYYGVLVPAKSVLEHFPKPTVTSQQVTCEIFGETIIVEADEDSRDLPRMIKRSRGAPPADERLLRDAIFIHLNALQVNGTLPAKKDAQDAEIQQFIRSKLGQEMPRTTAQRLRQQWVNTKDNPAQK